MLDPKIQQLIDTAKESKHTDAILLLIEKKPELAERIQKIVKESIPEDEWFKKAIAIVCEYVFNSCVWFLSDDKKEKWK